MITCHEINKSFKLHGENLPVLEMVSLNVEAGERVAILGPSGCGKSTLLALLAGFYPPDSGSIRVGGRISMMMQDDKLLPWRSVLDNVCLSCEVRNRRKLPDARVQAQDLLTRFGLGGFGDSFPAQLSGGMRQRAALLRTMMDAGEIWLLDEPFGKLDALTRLELQGWLIKAADSLKPALLLVTHDIDEALALTDRVYVFSHRPGRLRCCFTVDGDRQELKKKILKIVLEK